MPDDSSTIRIILADDSPTARRYLASLIREVAGMQVVGEARNGDEVVAMVAELKPDVVSMDIQMPRTDGLTATRLIMAQYPTPVVIVSEMVERDVALSLQALEAGALAVVGKPPARQHPAFRERRHELITTLRAMSDVRVISRRVYSPVSTQSTAPTAAPVVVPHQRTRRELLAIAASTGGPSALHRLLQAFPATYPLPIVIVQHMPDEFIGGLVHWLDSATALQVGIAQDRQILEAGQVVIAPGNCHLRVQRQGDALIARLDYNHGAYRYQPSADVLFESAARTCGRGTIGVVLTGMGYDGAMGLLAIRQQGGYTFVQDEASSTVFGMPRAAIEMEAAMQVLPLATLPTQILKLI